MTEVLTDFHERFQGLNRAFLECPDGRPAPVEIAAVWWHDGRLIFQFAGVDSIGKAEGLRGRLVLIPREERAVLGEGRYYRWELLGCEVVDRHSGRCLGKVAAVEPTGGVDLLKVVSIEVPTREVLVPFAQEICPEIDVRAHRIVIDPPEGLLELND